METPSILGLVAKIKDSDEYYRIEGCFLGGDFILRSIDGENFDCPAEEIELAKDVIYTPCGFIKQGFFAGVANEDGLFFVHHISPLRNLIYLQRSSRERMPFPVKPTEITKIFIPIKD